MPPAGPGRQDGASVPEEVFRAHWWPAVAAVTRQLGDLELAEDAVQDACAAALVQWPATGIPASPGAWLIGTARHKALDRMRRESRRTAIQARAALEPEPPGPASSLGGPPEPWLATADDELALVFTCCHPALDPAAR
ncbi:MAG: hypothetical protein J2P32_03125, partial [Actinobacteria bacterium]|nr:hypothetical protein [Actinomycetota bacterium]